MGGLTTLAATAVQALGAANTVMNAVESYRENSGTRDYKQAKAVNDLQMKQQAERAAFEKEQIRLASEGVEAERKAALRRAVARQRAQYGASGVSSADGSGQAVLLGLTEESDEDAARRDSLDRLKTAIIDRNLTGQQRINTLQLAQLQERNRLKKATSLFDSVTSVF